MRSSRRGRATDSGGEERLQERLESALAGGDGEAVLSLARRLLSQRTDDVRLLNVAAAAALDGAGGRKARSEAVGWLTRALQLAPGDVETLYRLGALAAQRGMMAAAEDYWGRAATADPDEPRVRQALTELWLRAGRLPDWGAELLEQRLLRADEPGLWSLLLDHYLSAGSLSAAGHRLVTRRFHQQADRDPRLIRVLAAELIRLERHDAPSRQVYRLLADDDPAAAAALVRCDARLRTFRADAVGWYRAALERGDRDAALLLAQGVLGGELPLAADGLAAIERVLAEATDREWRQFGLDRGQAVELVAGHWLAQPPVAEGAPAVERLLALRPGDAEPLRYLAAAWRPGLEPEQVAVYLDLLAAEPGDRANLDFLAATLLAGELDAPDPARILALWLPKAPEARRPAGLARLAEALHAAEREDEEARHWLRRAAAAGVLTPAPERRLAWLEAVRGELPDEALERCRRVLRDEAAPEAWRVTIGRALAASAPQPDDLRVAGHLLAAAGQGQELASLADRAGPDQAAALLDAWCRERFRAGDFALAADLAEALVARRDDDPAHLKLAVCRVRRDLAAGRRPAVGGLSMPERLRTLVAALGPEPPPDDSLAAALRAGRPTPVLAAAAAVIAGEVPPPGAAALLLDDFWLLSAVHQTLGAREEALAWAADSAYPELRLWSRYLQARDDPAGWQALLPVLKRREPPWTDLRRPVLDRAVRAAPPAQLDGLHAAMTRRQRLVLELRRVAELIDTAAAGDRVERLAPLLDDDRAARLRSLARLHQGLRQLALDRPDDALAALGAWAESDPYRDQAAWLRLLAATSRNDGPAVRRWAGELSGQARARPEVAWFLAMALPDQAEATLAAALRRHRERDDLRLELAARRARTGDAERFWTWAAPLAETQLGPAVQAVRRLLSGPLEQVAPAGECPALDRAAAAELLRHGRPTEALDRLAGATDVESLNLRAYVQLCAGDPAARESLLACGLDDPAVQHNLALVAESAGEPAVAAAHREAELAARGSDAEVWRFAQHSALARLYLAQQRPEEAVRHLEAALVLRPNDLAAQQASLAPLLAVGRGEAAVARSEKLLAATDELSVRLDHAAVLASTAGAPAAAAFLAELVADRPDAAEAVSAKRRELHERLIATVRERAAAQDHLTAFTVARDAATVAPTPAERARAALHQVVALGSLAERGEAVGRLEQALRLAGEVETDGAVPGTLRDEARRLAGQVGTRLAPHLAQQGEDLLRRREKQYQRLVGMKSPPRHAPRLHAALADAFDRVADLFGRAAALSGGRAAAAYEARRQRAIALATAARMKEENHG